jgi:type IV secretory pathway TrbF-like protein/sugar phosphate permease
MAFQDRERVHLANIVPGIAGHPAEAINRLLALPIWRLKSQNSIESLAQKWRLIIRVFLPFVAGYYLSYLFRTINALISSQLTSDLALGAADLGLLTSVYFLTFAAAQIPIGVLLDRYGPRRVQSALLMVASAGAALFGTAKGFIALVLARAMIGLGVAAALTAGLKAIILWFPKERAPLLNGYMIMLGGLGAVTATAPAEQVIDWVGWRGLFALLAAATASSSLLIYFVVPELSAAPSQSKRTPASLKTIYADSRFWRLAPLSATCVGSAWALQGLWAVPWLTDVESLDRATVITQLFVVALALSGGGLLLGTVADRMRRHGIGPQGLFSVTATLFIVAELTLILRLPLPSLFPWSVVAIVGAGTVLSYAILAEYFPNELAGRANGALNVFHLGGAFVFQYATGLIIDQWSSQDGHYPAVAYQAAFGLNVVLQIAALAWFELPRLRNLSSRWALCFVRPCPSHDNTLEPMTPYEKALRVWTDRLLSARIQASSWRSAALGSAVLCTVLGLAFAISVSRTEVTPYIREVNRLSEARTADQPGSAPSDAQIAYFLTRFLKNIRSLSTDPVVVRSNWMDALNYVTDHGAQTLGKYARDASPFLKIGLSPVAVEVIYVVRASDKSFEMHWREDTYQKGALAKTEHFTGNVEIVFQQTKITDTLSNPLGLYVHAFTWSTRHSNS